MSKVCKINYLALEISYLECIIDITTNHKTKINSVVERKSAKVDLRSNSVRSK